MTSLVLDIDDWPVAPGAAAIISREATYFLLMTGSNVNVTWYYKGQKIGSAVGLEGGDGIGPLSTPYDKVVLESATTQTCKVATTSDPVTITRLSGVVQIDGVVETAPDYSRVRAGDGFYAAKTKNGVTGEFAYFQLFNPVGSGVDFVIPEIYVRSDASGDQVNLFLTDTEADATNLNGFVQSPAASMKVASPLVFSGFNGVKVGSSAGGTALGGTGVGTVLEGNLFLKQPFVLEPGAGFVARSGSTAKGVSVAVQYFEVTR